MSRFTPNGLNSLNEFYVSFTNSTRSLGSSRGVDARIVGSP